MVEDFDNDRKKFHKQNTKKFKKQTNDDQKLEHKAKKAFKNRIMEMRDEESWEDIDYYDRNR